MGCQSSMSGGQDSEEPHTPSVHSLPAQTRGCSYIYLQEGWLMPRSQPDVQLELRANVRQGPCHSKESMAMGVLARSSPQTRRYL